MIMQSNQLLIYGNNILLLWHGVKCTMNNVKYTTTMTEIYEEYAKSSERMRELYKELAANAEKMTELYKESAKSTEKMSKYWLNYFWIKPLPENKQEENNRKGRGKSRDK
jgi:hypothetical protein